MLGSSQWIKQRFWRPNHSQFVQAGRGVSLLYKLSSPSAVDIYYFCTAQVHHTTMAIGDCQRLSWRTASSGHQSIPTVSVSRGSWRCWNGSIISNLPSVEMGTLVWLSRANIFTSSASFLKSYLVSLIMHSLVKHAWFLLVFHFLKVKDGFKWFLWFSVIDFVSTVVVMMQNRV